MKKIYLKYVPSNLHTELILYSCFPGTKMTLIELFYSKKFTIIENIYTVGEFAKSYKL